VFTSEEGLDRFIARSGAADLAGRTRAVMRGDALFSALLGAAAGGIVFDPAGPGRARSFERKLVELLAEKPTRTPAPAEDEPPPRELVEVRLLSIDPGYPIRTIKVIRDHTGLGLADAKLIVESAPVEFTARVARGGGDALITQLAEVRAEATVRRIEEPPAR
jgi:ribosomal protein L7/L12